MVSTPLQNGEEIQHLRVLVNIMIPANDVERDELPVLVQFESKIP